MKKYEVELTMLFKKKLTVMAEDRMDAADYAEELFFRTNALSFDKDDVLDITTRVQSEDTGYLTKYLDEVDDDYGCSDDDLDTFMDEDDELPFDGAHKVTDEDDDDEDADEEYADHLAHVLLDAYDTSKEALQEVVKIADELKKVTGENIYLALLR
jgi:hypothetical protein